MRERRRRRRWVLLLVVWALLMAAWLVLITCTRARAALDSPAMDTGLVTWRDPDGDREADRAPYGRCDPAMAERAGTRPRGTYTFEVWAVRDPTPWAPRYGACLSAHPTLAAARAAQVADDRPTALVLTPRSERPWLERALDALRARLTAWRTARVARLAP